MKQKYEPHELRLANEIAEILQDRKSLSWHLSLTRKYSEAFLRETLAEVMAVDEKRIWKSRAALFNHKITQHENGNDNSWS